MASFNDRYAREEEVWVDPPANETSPGVAGQKASDGVYKYECYRTGSTVVARWLRFLTAGWATEVPPSNTVAPAISGTIDFEETITCSTGTWSGAPTSYAYAWFVDGVLDPGLGTANAIVISGSLSQKTVKCRVSASNAYGSTTAYSNEVAIPKATPTNTVAPAITGTVDIGETITCDTGTWGDGAPTSYAYAWFVDGVLSAGMGTANNITIPHTLSLTTVTCRVTAINAYGSTAAFSNAVEIPLSPPVNTIAPVLSGTAEIGYVLTCSTGTWAHTPTGYTYAWFVDGIEDPSLGTDSSLLIIEELGGTAVTCQVTATNAAGSVDAVSNAKNIGSGYTPGLDFSEPQNSMYAPALAF